MSRTSLGTAGIILATLLAFPGIARASIIDVIWRMSGPQLVGAVLHCEYDPQFKGGSGETRNECRILDKKFAGTLQDRDMRFWWVSLDTGAYTSTGKDAEGHDYEAFKNNMVAFEPMLELGYKVGTHVRLHHGVAGLSYGVLFGPEFGTFDKAGLKFRPIGVTVNRKFNISYTLRVYPNGFTADQFGFGDPLPEGTNREAEAVHGFSVGFIW